MDIDAAATTDVPVLISGSPAEGEEVAHQLSQMSSPPRRLRVVHCGRTAPFEALMALGPEGGRPSRDMLLLQEVHALSLLDQLLLEQQLEAVRLHDDAVPLTRVVASSSVRLFGRVMQGQFRDRLFYLLNIIHIERDPRRPRG